MNAVSDLPDALLQAKRYAGKTNGAAVPEAKLKTAAAFCAEYVPLSYAIEPIVRSRSLYTLTAKTGAGKTALMVATALAVSTGSRDILSADVERGRVAYLAFENPDDVRMRLMIAAYLLNVNLGDLAGRLLILDVRTKPEDVFAKLASISQIENFSLILADTLAAWFDGKDINDNVQAGDFIRRVRPLTALPGNPSVLVAAHPTKGAGEEQIVPYGGGAILNEVDGNLTLWRRPDTGNVHLHWQGKLRGLEFKPRPFRFEIVGSPDILDSKGRQVQLPVIRPCAAADEEEKQTTEINRNAALLRAMRDNPRGKQADWADAIGRDKSNVNRRLQTLKGEKLVDVTLGLWAVTPKGEKALKPAEK
jgi:hypothetical protein